MKTPLTANLHPACVVIALLFITSARATERQILNGHVPKAAARSQPVGRLPGSSRLNLAIGLPLRNQEALSNLLEQLYDPASIQYRHYLTVEQFTEGFGPAEQNYEEVIAFAKSQGLTVTARHPNRMLLDVSGSVEDIERVFHVTIGVYQHPRESRTFHAPDVEPSLELGVRVLHVSGLDDFNRPHPLSHKMPVDHARGRRPLAGSAAGGGFIGNDFRAAYAPGVALTGAGQSVALVEFDGYYAKDITDYERLAGLPNVPLQNVLIGGFDGTPGSDNGEVALDIEMAISMAPGLSKVILYETGLYGNLNDLLNRIATDNLARQISCSWWDGYADQTTDQIFQQYAAQGQSFFENSGDYDAYSSDSVLPMTDNPYVTIVGGTELGTSGPGGAWVSETVWNPGYFLGVNSSVGSGGGISPTYLIPSWQQGISMIANKGSTSRRNTPDVAMVADNIWVLSNNGDSDAEWGTSAAAPLWAGFTALANELAGAHGQPPVGFVNPAIYALGKGASYESAFHDITVGNNNNSSSSQTGFPAVPGYDLCAGWGTPNGSNLLYALALPQLLHVTPATNFVASGAVGGPFSPMAQTYSLSNYGAVALDWTLAYAASWLDASASSGTLAPGMPAVAVSLSLNSEANNLPPGSYTANIWFTNLNDGSAQLGLFTLEVVTLPVITTGLVNQTVPEGATATFTVVAVSTALPSYTWNRDQTPLTDDGRISGSATSTLTISNVSSADAGTYSVYVQNALGLSRSGATLLTVPSPPVIVAPPSNQTVVPGAVATFAVGAVGSQPLFYQWLSHGSNVMSGGNTNVLILRNVGAADAGAYSVVVSNTLGLVTNGGAMLTVVPITAPGVTLATQYSFRDASDGANPNGLVQATNGLLYGTANAGGVNRFGTVFKITTNGALTTLHAFTGGSDGATPKAGLIQAADGNFYGTTYSGGPNFGGTVFRLIANGTLTTLHAFGAGSDGSSPFAAPLIQASEGNFYGTTSTGGNSNSGTVFKMTPNGSLTILHGFDGADGDYPRGALAQGSDGNFYGSTLKGGTNGAGTVFKVTGTGTFISLFQFERSNGISAAPRGGLVQGRDGNFYGAAFLGGEYGRGTVFRITTNGLLTTLHSFTGTNDGQLPNGALIEGKDGNFYGTTSYGGLDFNGAGYTGEGTVFRMTPNGALSTLAYFDGFNGANPSAALVQASDGSFYGTTLNGGANGYGAIFRLTVPQPTLNIALSANGVVLSWPSWASDLFLQQTSDLAAANWTAVTNSPTVTNLQNQVVVAPAPTADTFYRLSH
jgi:uncharacterized repeat protein (TIGR03803 family)